MGVLVKDRYVFLRQAHAKFHTTMLPGYYSRRQGKSDVPNGDRLPDPRLAPVRRQSNRPTAKPVAAGHVNVEMLCDYLTTRAAQFGQPHTCLNVNDCGVITLTHGRVPEGGRRQRLAAAASSVADGST